MRNKTQKIIQTIACLLFIPVVLFHAAVGIALFPWFLITNTPDAPLARLAMLLMEKFGIYGFLCLYVLPLIALCGWSTSAVMNLEAKRNK